MRVTAVTTTIPGPRKPRLLGFVRALRLAGQDVSVVVTSDLSQAGASAVDDEGLAMLEELGVSCVHVPFTLHAPQMAHALASIALRRSCTETALYDSRRLAERFAVAVDGTRPDVVHVDRVRTFSLVRHVPAPVVVDVTDPRLGSYRHYRDSGQLRPLSVGLAATMRAWLDQRPARWEEAKGLHGVPVLVASEIGRQTLLDAGADPMLVRAIPNVVFPEERVEPQLACPGSAQLVGMSGNLSYPPNVLAFEEFTQAVCPALHSELGARCVVIGSSPHRALVRAARRAGVEVYPNVTSVPETIRRLQIAVMVSPQRVSTGFPNRVVDAVYRAGTPIVASLETVRGAPEELAPHIPLATDTREWVSQVRTLVASARHDLHDRVTALQGHIEDVCGPGIIAEALLVAYERARSDWSRPAPPVH